MISEWWNTSTKPQVEHGSSQLDIIAEFLSEQTVLVSEGNHSNITKWGVNTNINILLSYQKGWDI